MSARGDLARNALYVNAEAARSFLLSLGVVSRCDADRLLEALRHLPGKHSQKSHGDGAKGTIKKALTGKAALKAAPLSTVSRIDFNIRLIDDAGLTPGEADDAFESLAHYQHGASVRINKALQDAKGGTPDLPEASGPFGGRVDVANIDAALEHSRLTDDVIVYQGQGDRITEDAERTVYGYASTSADKKIALDYAKGGIAPTVVELHVPKGTPAIHLGPHPAHEESELLLARGLRRRRVADRGVVDGVRRIVEEVIPDGAGMTGSS